VNACTANSAAPVCSLELYLTGSVKERVLQAVGNQVTQSLFGGFRVGGSGVGAEGGGVGWVQAGGWRPVGSCMVDSTKRSVSACIRRAVETLPVG
jgi:hypothetical protein